MDEPLYNTIEIRETVDGQQEMSSGESKPRKEKSMSKVRRPDPYLWGIYMTLLVISVIELFSASSAEVSGSNVYVPAYSWPWASE